MCVTECVSVYVHLCVQSNMFTILRMHFPHTVYLGACAPKCTCLWNCTTSVNSRKDVQFYQIKKEHISFHVSYCMVLVRYRETPSVMLTSWRSVKGFLLTVPWEQHTGFPTKHYYWTRPEVSFWTKELCGQRCSPRADDNLSIILNPECHRGLAQHWRPLMVNANMNSHAILLNVWCYFNQKGFCVCVEFVLPVHILKQVWGLHDSTYSLSEVHTADKDMALFGDETSSAKLDYSVMGPHKCHDPFWMTAYATNASVPKVAGTT